MGAAVQALPSAAPRGRPSILGQVGRAITGQASPDEAPNPDSSASGEGGELDDREELLNPHVAAILSRFWHEKYKFGLMISTLIEPLVVPRNYILYSQGEVADAVYLITAGYISLVGVPGPRGGA